MNWTNEQLEAINDTGTNIIVSAGAGSGKTAVLTERTMRILREGTHITELLVLTFTKAAAGEMKNRIRKEIKKNINNSPELKKELELIDQSYITTFDSYALSIVKKYHYLLNISNEIEISDSSIIEMQKRKIMDEVFDKYYENNNPDFSKLIYDFCVKDDYELKRCILKIADKIDGLTNRDEYLNSYKDSYLSDSFINSCIKEYEDTLKSKVKTIRYLYDDFSALADSTYSSKINDKIRPLYTCNTLEEFLAITPYIKLDSVPKGSSEEVKEAKEKINTGIKDINKLLVAYGNREDLLSSIEIMKQYVTVIVSIIKDYLTSLHKYKEDNMIYDFQDIALLSIRILEENEAVREEIKNSFKEIMIDEYQDTNDIQEKFISMIENNNVYMVGDIKQSIYRFRNANPNIFKNKYDNYANLNNGIKIDLVQNFRSRSEVLANINEIFNLIMDNIIGGAEYHESHQMVFGNQAYNTQGKTDNDNNLEIREYELEKDSKFDEVEVEIFAVAKDIKEKIASKYQVYDKDLKILRDIQYSDFTILMDRSTEFDRYKKVFEYLGIPMTVYRDFKLNESDDIYILKNIINLIVKISENNIDEEFKYAFTSIARCYLFELSDNEILKTFNDNSFKESIIYHTFAPLAEDLRATTTKELLEEIIKITNMYEKFIKVGNMNDSIMRISKLLDIATNLGNLGYNIFIFKDYLNDLLSSEEEMKYKPNYGESNSVKIMNIHTSKGLEFPICYYTGLYKEFNNRELKDRYLFDNKYGIVTPFFNEGINEIFMKYLLKNHYMEEEVSEKIRLFYVALTRAREKMIIFTPKVEETIYALEDNNTIDINVRRKYKSFSTFLDSVKDKISKYYQEIEIESLNITKDYLYSNTSLPELSKTNSKTIEVEEINIPQSNIITQEHFSKNQHELITIDNKKNMEFGTQVHETLEYLDFINPDYSLIDNNFIKSKIQKFLSNQLLSNIKEANIYKEYEFIYTNENNEYHGIIDLMLEYDDKIDIIDYKLNNIKDENYLKQLEGYKNYIKTISNKDINIYLYSILSETIEKL